MELINVIKYEGNNDTFVWKHPVEDFNTSSQLIVHENQEAVFYMNGQILDVFNAGRYTLQTENIPLIKKVLSIPTGGESPFHCELYFINKAYHMGIRWGTESKIEYIEPIYNFPIKLGANGEIILRVSDSKKLLVKLVGTENFLNNEKIIQYFRSILNLKLKTHIAKVIKENRINVFEIDGNLEEISENIKENLASDFFDFGIEINRFIISTVVKPDGESIYEKFKELHIRQYTDIAEAELSKKVGIIEYEKKKEQMIIEAEGVAEKRKKEGYTYQEERGFDVAEGVAKNEGGNGNLAGLGIGLGVMSGIGGTAGTVIAKNINNAFSNIDNNDNEFCTKCGYKFKQEESYCPKCGEKRQ